ncbi:kinase-like protein [Polyplosphaeria fusca]|uniref:EKC/KEOPS complex subunit BUD32 n=1 Tax=Polyplosphaeria fusca TaxID=682080 RepID=A0A9P4QFQ6_9PLEO|nr:kinase-like protein [Polyplosphaeria fusca]
MEMISNKGRTSMVYRVGKGLVCKIPYNQGSNQFLAEVDNAFAVESRLLEKLGNHPRIVPYYGPYMTKGDKDGLLLGEADCGDLQSHIDRGDMDIDNGIKTKWCLQAAESLSYTHENGIIHSDFSTTNILVHQGNIILADFGGSRCPELHLDGNLIPDDPFRDPQLTEFGTPKVDVFSLGVVIYVIMTGHYPFHQGPAPQNEERFTYGDSVRLRFSRGEFPDLCGVPFGDIIAGCCCERRFETAKEVVVALRKACAADGGGFHDVVEDAKCNAL